MLGGALACEGDVTSEPESKQAEDLLDERLPRRESLDEVVIVRSDRLPVRDADFRARIKTLAGELRRSHAVDELSTYLDRGGEGLVSSDRHATVIPLVLAEDEEDSIEDVVDIIRRADGASGFAVDITGEFTVGRDFQEVSKEDLSNGELPHLW